MHGESRKIEGRRRGRGGYSKPQIVYAMPQCFLDVLMVKLVSVKDGSAGGVVADPMQQVSERPAQKYELR